MFAHGHVLVLKKCHTPEFCSPHVVTFFDEVEMQYL